MLSYISYVVDNQSYVDFISQLVSSLDTKHADCQHSAEDEKGVSEHYEKDHRKYAAQQSTMIRRSSAKRAGERNDSSVSTSRKYKADVINSL